MIENLKICGVSDSVTLHYILNHSHPPKFIGFITNYKKSKRFVEYNKLKDLINVKKNKVNFVSVLVNPTDEILEKIRNLNFDYYQLYDVCPMQTRFIKERYKIKIITALKIGSIEDVMNYKKYRNISDIVLFDGQGYEKSIAFNHDLISNVPKNITKMLAGNIQYYDKLEKFNKITDIIDISGSLETSGEKDIKKINVFLNNAKKK